MNGIVEYGANLKHRLSVGALSLDQFKAELQGRTDIESNDWGVLQCYFERDERVFLVLHELSVRQMADSLAQTSGELGYKGGMILLCNELKRSLEIERHFPPASCLDGKFVQCSLDQYRAAYGDRWPEFVRSADLTEQRLPFLKPQLDRVRAYADLYPTAG